MAAAAPHPLAAVLERAALGAFPPTDGRVELLPPDHDGTLAVVEFTAHSYLLADVDPAEVAARGLTGYGTCTTPATLQWLAGDDREIGTLDVLLVGRGRGERVAPPRADLDDHPRVVRARHRRTDIEVRSDGNGVAVLGRGVVGRLELAVELFEGTPAAHGAGRRLIELGLAAVPDGSAVWAQVAAGNAASLRAFLAAGFHPVGSEVLIGHAVW